MANVYNNAKEQIMNGFIDLDADTLVLLLLQETPNFDADDNSVSDVLADAANDEVTVTGYSRQTLGAVTVTQDDVNDRAEADAADVVFSSLAAGETVGAAVLYRQVTTDADHIPIAFYDVTDTPTNGGDITIQWGSEGFLHLT
jgi:hypothetical protein